MLLSGCAIEMGALGFRAVAANGVAALLMSGDQYTRVINVAVLGLVLSIVVLALPARLLDRPAG